MNLSQEGAKKLDLAISLLKFSFAAYFLVVGLDKFVFLFSDWGHFVSSVVTQFVPFNLTYLLYGLGAIEVLIGLYILFMCACSGGILAAVFFGLLVVNMLLMKVYVGALIYLLLVVSAYVLSLLVGVKKEAS
jgi:hypothetical protein